MVAVVLEDLLDGEQRGELNICFFLPQGIKIWFQRGGWDKPNKQSLNPEQVFQAKGRGEEESGGLEGEEKQKEYTVMVGRSGGRLRKDHPSLAKSLLGM